MKFVFVHKHGVVLLISQKKSNNSFEINNYGWVQQNQEIEILNNNIFYSIYCQSCKEFLAKTREKQEFYVRKKKVDKIINYYNDTGEIEKVFYENESNVNLIRNSDFIFCDFYKSNGGPEYDTNSFYVGTKDEQLEYFHKQCIDLKKKISEKEIEYKNNKSRFEDGEKELQELRAGIRFKGDMGEGQEAYDIIIDINSILSLNKAGWSIKYPKGIEVYENKRKKPAIIIGVLGNRNKGKSFILGNYLDMMFLKAFL